VSTNSRSAVGVGAAVLVAVAIAFVLGARDPDSANPSPGDQPTNAPRALSSVRPQHRSRWVAEANAVCRLGRKLYPSIALGAGADPDTIDYAVTRLVNDIAAIAISPPASGREQLVLRGRAAVAAWRSLATRQPGTVTPGARREAARTAAQYVNQVILLGAAACESLRPAATERTVEAHITQICVKNGRVVGKVRGHLDSLPNQC
jgi:hypothetical protein